MSKKRPPQAEEIGIRELKSRTSEVVRSVKEERARYVITQRGKPAALIVPLDAAPPEGMADQVWDRLLEIGKKVSEGWRNKQSAVEILSEIRR
jgi:prevent-host-death family protein